MVKRSFSNLLSRESRREDPSIKTLRAIKKIAEKPVLHYAIFAILLSVIKILSEQKILQSSFATAVGSTIIFCIVGLGFCLLLGYSALASLGTAGFIAVGAYCAYFCLSQWELSIGTAFLLAILVAFVVGVVVGFISLRIEGIYLAIVTLGVAQILKEVFAALKDTIRLTGKQITIPWLNDFRITTDHVYFILVIALFILMILTKNLMNSPTGRAMLAMKNSTSAAQAFGISLMKYRLLAFVLSTIYAAIGGFLYMLFIRNASNSSDTLFALSTSLNILGAVIIGGTKSIWGTIGGTFIIYGIDKMFLQDIEFFRANPTLITLFCGILVILVVMFFPGGLVQLLYELKLKIKRLIAKIREGIYGKDIG